MKFTCPACHEEYDNDRVSPGDGFTCLECGTPFTVVAMREKQVNKDVVEFRLEEPKPIADAPRPDGANRPVTGRNQAVTSANRPVTSRNSAVTSANRPVTGRNQAVTSAAAKAPPGKRPAPAQVPARSQSAPAPAAGRPRATATQPAPAAPAARKPCPVCGELIVSTAKKCRFCGEVLEPAHDRPGAPASNAAPRSGTPRNAAVRGNTARNAAVAGTPTRQVRGLGAPAAFHRRSHDRDYEEMGESYEMGAEYAFSGRFEPLKLLVGMTVGIVCVFIVAVIYAYAVHYCPLIYINFLITGGCGFLVAIIAIGVFELTNTRNDGLGVGIAVILTLFALYFTWVATVRIYSEPKVGLEALNPLAIVGTISALIDEQSFTIGLKSLKFFTISGWWLAIVYLIEAAIIALMGIFPAAGVNAMNGFCEDCQQWTKKKFKLPPLSPEAAANEGTVILEGLRDGTIQPLLALTRVDEHAHHARFTIQTCKCGGLNLLELNDVTVEEKDGKFSESKTEVFSRIIISPEAAKALQNAKWADLGREPAKSPPHGSET